MAMATYLQMVSSDELAALEAAPTSVNQLDQPTWMMTYYACTLNYFLTGSAYPGEHALASMLQGSRTVDTSTLENGSFGVIDATAVPALVTGLEAVDRNALKSTVEAADLNELVADEELYELEVMDPAEVPSDVVTELGKLVEFYRKVKDAGASVVCYTT